MSLRDHLQAIYDERGELTPALVVDVARDEDHPLHHRFEWNDSVGAEKYRRHQAHALIRSVRISYATADASKLVSIRAFYAVKDQQTNQFAYEPAQVVMQNPMAMQLVLAQMERDWKAIKRRYDEFEEFWDMVTDEARVIEGLGI